MGRQFREYAVLSAVQFPALSGNRGAKLSPLIVLRLALGLLGLGFLTIASWALVLDGLRLISDEPFRWISTGEMWFRLHPDSLQIAQPVIQRYTVAEAAYLVGLAQMDFEISVDYAKERVQFGRPIGSFQAIQHKCADMVTDVDGSRFIMYKAAWSVNTDQDDRQMAVNMAKAWTSDATRRVVAHGQQIHGGIGFTKDYKIQLYYRRQKRAELAFGDTEHHRELVAQQLGI